MSSSPRSFRPGRVSYEGSVASDYQIGRALSAEAAAVWREVLGPFLDGASTVLDLGSGTGRFWPVLASFAPGQILGVEPSLDMLRVAASAGLPGCHAVVGRAEQIPLRTGGCDLAWMSQSLHHVADKAACARELVRVLRPSSYVLVRGTFSDHLDGFPALFRFFPEARAICQDLPTVDSVVSTFTAAGLTFEATRWVEQQTCGSLREFQARSRRRADSSLALMADQAFLPASSSWRRWPTKRRVRSRSSKV